MATLTEEKNATFSNKVAEAAVAAGTKTGFKLQSGGSSHAYNKQNSLQSESEEFKLDFRFNPGNTLATNQHSFSHKPEDGGKNVDTLKVSLEVSKDEENDARFPKTTIKVSRFKAVDKDDFKTTLMNSSHVNIVGALSIDSVFSSKEGDEKEEVARPATHNNASLLIEENQIISTAPAKETEEDPYTSSSDKVGKLIQMDKTAMNKTMNFPA